MLPGSLRNTCAENAAGAVTEDAVDDAAVAAADASAADASVDASDAAAAGSLNTMLAEIAALSLTLSLSFCVTAVHLMLK